MKLYLLTQKPFAPTVKRLAEVLSDKLGYKVFRRKTVNPLVKKYKPFEYLNGSGIDKKKQFELFAANEVTVPLWTTEQAVASTWDGQVCCRTLINSSQGKGLVITESAEVVPAPLYTLYVKKRYEFRVQVFNGKPLRSVIKLKRSGVERETTQVRNLDNGYIFANIPDYVNDDVVEKVEALAIKAVAALGYKYGAADIIYNEKKDEAYCLEVNSAPAMEGTTLEVYSNAIVGELNV